VLGSGLPAGQVCAVADPPGLTPLVQSIKKKSAQGKNTIPDLSSYPAAVSWVSFSPRFWGMEGAPQVARAAHGSGLAIRRHKYFVREF